MATTKSTIVVLDDYQQWVEIIQQAILRVPEAAGVRVATFTTDSQARRFVEQQAADIFGYIQDLNRDESNFGGVSEGVRFLDDVITRLTPWARTIIVSGYADLTTLRQLFTVPGYEVVDFLDKGEFDYKMFRKALLRLLEGRFVEAVHEAPEPDALASAIVHTLDLPWNDVCRSLVQYPQSLHAMDPRKFEELVAEMFRSYGWEVDLTSRTRDGGYDIIAVRRQGPTDIRVLAEAKRFSPDRPVGVEIVRSLYAVKSLNAATQVVLATSSYVSPVAKKEFSRVVPWELDFLERDKILGWCKNYGAISLG